MLGSLGKHFHISVDIDIVIWMYVCMYVYVIFKNKTLGRTSELRGLLATGTPCLQNLWNLSLEVFKCRLGKHLSGMVLDHR